MQRIRTVKPEFFKHFDLYQAESKEKLPLRLAFVGLWTCVDREGRFKWRPEELKVCCLPYDNVDFLKVLDALVTRGFIVKYEVNGEMFGCVPSFGKHQVINNRERESALPPIESGRVVDASVTPLVQDQEEGKGKEGNGKGREGNTRYTREQEAKDKDSYPEEFITFWEAYPKHRAKKDALKAWEDLKPEPDLVDRMVRHLKQRIHTYEWKKEEGQFIPLPATFIRGRLWEDEIKVKAAGPVECHPLKHKFGDPYQGSGGYKEMKCTLCPRVETIYS